MKTLATILTFVAGSTIAATALAFCFGGVTVAVSLIALAIGLIAAGFAWIQTKEIKRPPLRFWDYALLGVFALASFRAFCWLIFFRGDDICILSPNNLGDICLHINFIRYLASGVPFWPESSILTGVPLSYPLGSDLFNALGEVLGLDTFRGLVLTGLIGAGLTGFALWRWGGAFGVAALLFNGGLVGFEIFRTGEFVDFQQSLVWKNIFLTMLVTQRGLLFALPAGLLLLTHWRDTYYRDKPGQLPRWLEILFYGGMPLFNVHAFLFLSLFLAAIFLTRPTARRSTFTLVASCLVPASLFVYLVTGFFSANGHVRWEPSWIMEQKGWLTWIWDFGFALPLGLLLSALLIRKGDAETRCFVWSAAFIFVICCVIVFAPWPWDNMKLMIWSWLVIAPYLWTNLIARFELIPRVAICIGLFFSGAVSLIGGLDAKQGYSIAKRSELAAWQVATSDIPATARFACTPDYNHPIILLGRKVACGYDGHLWSHGLNYSEKYALLKSALNGEIPWNEAGRTLQVDWLALRPTEVGGSGEYGVLYDIRPLLKPSSGNPAALPPPPRTVDSIW